MFVAGFRAVWIIFMADLLRWVDVTGRGTSNRDLRPMA